MKTKYNTIIATWFKILLLINFVQCSDYNMKQLAKSITKINSYIALILLLLDIDISL